MIENTHFPGLSRAKIDFMHFVGAHRIAAVVAVASSVVFCGAGAAIVSNVNQAQDNGTRNLGISKSEVTPAPSSAAGTPATDWRRTPAVPPIVPTQPASTETPVATATANPTSTPDIPGELDKLTEFVRQKNCTGYYDTSGKGYPYIEELLKDAKNNPNNAGRDIYYVNIDLQGAGSCGSSVRRLQEYYGYNKP